MVILGGALLLWAAVVAVVSGVAITRAGRLRRQPPHPTAGTTPVLVVRPCAGLEPGLEDRLVATAAARRPLGSLTVGLSVADPADGALPAIEAAATRLRALDIPVVVRVIDPGEAPNRKAAQLVAWLADAPPTGALVCIDSDVDLVDFPLDSLLAPLEDLTVGATWAPPAEHGGHTAGDRASAAFLGASLHAFALLGPLDPAGLVGKVFAVRVAAVHAAGGLDGLENTLGEDMEIARRLRHAGYHTRLVPTPARAVPSGRSHAEVVARFARWLAVIRAQRPALLLSYPLLFGATFPLVILGLALPGPLATAAAVLAASTRILVALAAQHFSGLPPTLPLRAIAEAEWLTWRAFLRAARTREVEWRGRRLRILPGGRLGT